MAAEWSRRASVLSTKDVWTELEKASFAVVAHVTPDGAPRSSGISYRVVGETLCVVVGGDSWKARHMANDDRVAVTVPVRRGGVLTLVLPIPPATISFHGSVVVHPVDSDRGRSLLEEVGTVLPPERRLGTVVLQIAPEGHFVTYGIGVPLRRMRDPAEARARVPVGSSDDAASTTGSG